MKKLSSTFYQQSTPDIARQLLGTYLVRRTKNGILAGKITETEAYVGFSDRASHASRGKTARNEPMFYKGGCVYVYLVYGMYHCFNVVTEKEDYPAAVLIRAVEISNKSQPKADEPRAQIIKTDGPGKLCRYFQIDKSLNKADLRKSKEIWIAEGKESVLPENIVANGRIGVDYAGKYWANRKWRFLLKS